MLLSVIAVYEESDVADAGTDAMQGHHCRTSELLCWSHRCNDAGCYAEEHAAVVADGRDVEGLMLPRLELTPIFAVCRRGAAAVTLQKRCCYHWSR